MTNPMKIVNRFSPNLQALKEKDDGMQLMLSDVSERKLETKPDQEFPITLPSQESDKSIQKGLLRGNADSVLTSEAEQ